MELLIKTHDLEILTPTGWSKFDGVKRQKTKSIVVIKTENNLSLRCTKNHLLKTDGIWKEAYKVKTGSLINTKSGTSKIIANVTEKIEEYVYDLLEVKLEHAYWTNDIESHNCQFLGSSTTLLETDTLVEMKENWEDPIRDEQGWKYYEFPQPGRNYVLCVDTSRGLGLDYHAIVVIDVTNLPWKLIGTFHDNKIYPTIFPNVIANAAKKFNNAHILVEISDIGQQVADMLIGDLDCENVIRISQKPGLGQQIGFGFGGKIANGIKTSTATKRIGAADLKTLIESRKLIITDKETIREFFTFVASNQSYAAEQGYHDDLVMCLVMFGWLSHQRYFREENQDIRDELEKQQSDYFDQQLIPFGVYDDGISQVSYDYEADEAVSYQRF